MQINKIFMKIQVIIFATFFNNHNLYKINQKNLKNKKKKKKNLKHKDSNNNLYSNKQKIKKTLISWKIKLIKIQNNINKTNQF